MDTNYKAAYPGKDVLARNAEGYCALLFASNKIAPADKDNTLRFRALVPGEQAWEHVKTEDEPDGGARDAFCLVFSANGSQLTDTVLAKTS
ncbi:MAG TPA: hypothetical protein VGD48_28235 [Kutzneria sp.]